MVSDREPRYQLLDSSGTVVGTFYQKADGTLAVQDGVSESEVVFDGDTLGSGSETVNVGSVSTNTLTIGQTVGKLRWNSGGSNQSVADKTITTVSWDSNTIEDSDVVSVDVTNNKITIQKSGLYLVKTKVHWAADSGWSNGDNKSIQIAVNGTTKEADESESYSTNRVKREAYYIRNLSQGDEIVIQTFQNSGASKELDSGSSVSQRLGTFEVVRLG